MMVMGRLGLGLGLMPETWLGDLKLLEILECNQRYEIRENPKDLWG